MSGSTSEQDLIVSRDPDVMGGTPVFACTRVPVQALIDELAAGSSIYEFREGYPRVTLEQITTLLRRLGEMLQTVRV